MNLFNDVLSRIETNALNKKQGKFNGIPYPFPRLGRYIPSIDKEQVVGITSYSGAGKSKFTRSVFVNYPYEFSMINDYPILIDYYALEDSSTKIFKSILCNYLHSKHKIRLSLFDLDSKFKELSPDVIRHIKSAEKYMQDFNVKVRIKDTFTSNDAIRKDVLKTANDLGEIKYETVSSVTGHTAKQIVGFTPKDDTHWMIICDNLNNIDGGKEAMDHFVQQDCRLLYAKIFKASCIVIHQQALEAEKAQFTSSGGFILDKIKPSLATLGGTKEVVRSYHLVFGLFNPHKFKIKDYKGYDTELVANNFREIEVLKFNDGYDNVSTALYFDGAAEVFSELPHSKDNPEDLKKFYDWLQTERFNKKHNLSLF